MRLLIRNFNPPGIWTFENWLVQISASQDRKVVKIPYPSVELDDTMFQSVLVYTVWKLVHSHLIKCTIHTFQITANGLLRLFLASEYCSVLLTTISAWTSPWIRDHLYSHGQNKKKYFSGSISPPHPGKAQTVLPIEELSLKMPYYFATENGQMSRICPVGRDVEGLIWSAHEV